ncbi:MAG: zinc-dependent alcohol dehydrogenase family protein [Lachnospiraceae bacterium]
MKAAVYLGKEKIETREEEIPQIRENEVLIKVMASGICGTDVHIFYGAPGATEPNVPVILGHEFAGEVVKCGSEVSRLKVGDKVTIDPNMYCGNCDYCQKGKKHFCPSMSAIGVNQNGGFEEYCAVPEKQAILLSSDVDYEEAAMAEPVACCLHGIDNIGITQGDTVCVIGGGAIGQIMIQLARISGASKVILSEPVEGRRELALSLGADAAIDPMAGDPKEQIKEILGRDYTDVVIECVGRPVAVSQAIHIAGRGSKVLLFGLPYPTDTCELPLGDVFYKELTIKSSYVNPNTQYRAAELISTKRLNLKPLITHRYPVEKLEEAIKKQMANDSVKVVVLPHGNV